MPAGPLLKFWDYSNLITEVNSAVRQRVENAFREGAWESILFTLPNEPPFACRIEARLADGTTLDVEPDSPVRQAVRALVDLLGHPPATRWTRLLIEHFLPMDSVIELH